MNKNNSFFQNNCLIINKLCIFTCVFLLCFNIIFARTYSYDKKYIDIVEDINNPISKENEKIIRDTILAIAKGLLDEGYSYNESTIVTHPITKEEKKFLMDCSGFIAAVYWASNIVVFDKQALVADGGVRTMHKTLSKYNKIYKEETPGVGDIIMFDRTTSNNRDLSHAGLVIGVDENKTVSYIHSTVSKGLMIGYMNLEYTNDRLGKNNELINSTLKRGGGASAYASNLFNSFGTVLSLP